MTHIDGVLIWDEQGKELRAQWTRERDGALVDADVAPADFADGDLARACAKDPASLHLRPIELRAESVGNTRRARDIQPVLTAAQRRERDQAERAARVQEIAARRHTPGLYNPYGFVPAPPRDARTLAGPLGDGPPASHAHYAPDLWSGVIRVQMTTRTPLLLRRHVSSEELADGKEHRIYETRRLPGRRGAGGSAKPGAPDLHPTALKGMLSAAFETVTNSRMRIFDHRTPLTQRLLQQETMSLRPVRVTAGADGALEITEMTQVRLPRYLTGGTPELRDLRKLIQEEGERHDPAYHMPTALRLGGLSHGTPVQFDAFTPAGSGGPIAWRVQPLTAGVTPSGPDRGWVVMTGRNPAAHGATAKRHEAIFVELGGGVHPIPAWAARILAVRWRAVATATFHAREQPGAIQITGGWLLGTKDNADLWTILRRDGQLLCWARTTNDESIDQLVPNRYGRITHPLAPYDVVPKSLRPAENRSELSPADRVFGWTAEGRGDGVGARHRGHLRIARVRLASDPATAITTFPGEGILLDPLASPKPNQVLFYTAKDKHGTPWSDRSLDDARTGAYADTGAIRGRKVYPARNGTSFRDDVYPPSAAAAHTTLNSTIRSWVNPDVTFTFELRVTNLSRAELGALLWLITRPDDHRLRLGGGRPLGFGEVHLTCLAARVRTGAETRDRLLALADDAPPSSAPPLPDPAQLADEFELIAPAGPRTAFEAAMRGYPADAEVAYPHLPGDPAIHHWFARNQLRHASQRALPMLDHPETIINLPLDPG